MKGDPGPYLNDAGDRWVPRTVPFREAREVARVEVEAPFQRLRYVGKAEGIVLVGFARECDCEEWCYGGPVGEDGDPGVHPDCRVPAWHFRVEERT